MLLLLLDYLLNLPLNLVAMPVTQKHLTSRTPRRWSPASVAEEKPLRLLM
jgi:hypothetical protein